MALSEIENQIMEVYIATFNRAPDIDGLNYWLEETSNNNWNINDVAKSMMESNEAINSFPDNQTNSQFITSIYQNVLGRTPDSSGLTYWLEQMTNGIEKTEMILAVVNGAKADSGDPDDKQYLSNKKELAQYLTFDLKSNDIELSTSAMSLITLDTESINIAKDKIDLFYYIENDTPFVFELNDDANSFNSYDENEIVYSLGGNDILNLGEGDNIVVSGSGNDTVYTGSGDDTIKLREGDDIVYSGEGDDIIYGNSGEDTIHAENGNDIIYSNEDDDIIYADDGDDLIYSGSGDDFIRGGLGFDIIYGDDGDDIIYTDDGEDFVDGGTGNDIIYGGVDANSLYGGAGEDKIQGGDGNDTIDGNLDDDIIYSGLGDDITFGGEGDDTIYGNDGDDHLDGGVGNDIIYGGTGIDILTGGTGKDKFYFITGDSELFSEDLISDFEFATSGYDKIVLVDQGTEKINSTKIDVSSASVLSTATSIALAGDGSTNAIVSWFIFKDNTYIVQDLSTLTTFDYSTDIIIELQGIVDLTGLSSSTILFE